MHRLSKPLCYLYKLPKMLRSRRRTFTLPTNLKYLVHVRYSTSKLFERVAHLQSKVAITDANDKKQYTYANILRDSASVACNLQLQKGEIKGKRICFLFDPSYEYVVTMLGIWRAGAVVSNSNQRSTHK
jgi:acyl-CoA synthetase (AMP-forming)/AMP-acid ligase II